MQHLWICFVRRVVTHLLNDPEAPAPFQRQRLAQGVRIIIQQLDDFDQLTNIPVGIERTLRKLQNSAGSCHQPVAKMIGCSGRQNGSVNYHGDPRSRLAP
jgi:hypothetical protein